MGVTYSTGSASTYIPIATYTVTGSATSTISFTSFAGYTDLRIVISGQGDTSGYMALLLNNDASSLYSRTNLVGDGTSATSGRASSNTALYADTSIYNASMGSCTVLDLFNYANTTTYKTALERAVGSSGTALTSTIAWVFLYRSTNAITSLYFNGSGGASLRVGLTISLYGIKAAG
jgi:hypothetical protein